MAHVGATAGGRLSHNQIVSMNKAGIFLSGLQACCHTYPSQPAWPGDPPKALHWDVAALSPVFWVFLYLFMSNWSSDHPFLLGLLTQRS